MEIWTLMLTLAVGWQIANRLQQRERITLLATHVGRLQIERDMASLLEGYLPALTESDPARRAHKLALLQSAEQRLAGQLLSLQQSLAEVWGERTRISRWPLAVPWATRLFPQVSFNLADLLRVHADGLAAAVANADGLPQRERAFRITAELMLFQHSCHWYCRSLNMAHARLLAHHQTGHAQVLEAVGPGTRRDYSAITLL
jgi:hypothetical protein